MSTLHQLVFVTGLFGIPVMLLLAGHRLRRRSLRRQRTFWGAVLGHLAACAGALLASLFPLVGWLPTDHLRGAVGIWGLLLLPLVGAALASLPRSRD